MEKDTVNAADGVDVKDPHAILVKPVQPEKGDMWLNGDHFELFTGERWVVVPSNVGESVHHYGNSCNNKTIAYATGICNVCGARWKLANVFPGTYWEPA